MLSPHFTDGPQVELAWSSLMQVSKAERMRDIRAFNLVRWNPWECDRIENLEIIRLTGGFVD